MVVAGDRVKDIYNALTEGLVYRGPDASKHSLRA
jgi:hypothetical protein